MKTSKQLLTYLLSGSLLLPSCTKENIQLPESTLKKVSAEFKLIEKRALNDNEVHQFNLRSFSYKSSYEYSFPIYRYVYGGTTNLDHYFGTENATSISHHGKGYAFEKQEFNLLPSYTDYKYTQALFRHYSASLEDHMLSTSSSMSGYTSEGIIGYIYSTQQVGTVPLKEFYSSTRKKHHYVMNNVEAEDYIPKYDADFKYVKTIGYVYPGQGIDNKKTATNFIIKNQPPNPESQIYVNEVILKIKVREGNNYWELSYSAKPINKVQDITVLPIKNTYTVVAAEITFNTSYTNRYYTNTFENITNSDFITKEQVSSIYFRLTKELQNYQVIYSYTYSHIPVGSK